MRAVVTAKTSRMLLTDHWVRKSPARTSSPALPATDGAVVQGDELTVYGFLVTDDGSFEMQVYNRTLTEFGMDLTFTRQRKDGVFRRISGTLRRVAE